MDKTRKKFIASEDFYDLGIGIKNNKGYIYTSSFEYEEYFINTNQLLSHYIPKNKTESFPLDFVFSPDFSFLVISNRAEGSIHIINTKTDEIIKTFEIRAKGGSKTINIAISNLKNKVFITDNQTSIIYTIDLKTLAIESKSTSLGILGNIILSPDQESIYVITLKPKQTLKLINSNDLSLKKDFPLKGDLFSLSESSYDILTMSKNNDFIYLMTHIPDPEAFTPVITVFDVKEEKAIKRFSIKDSTKPIMIGSVEINPIFFENKEILQILVDKNILDFDKLDKIYSIMIENSFNEPIFLQNDLIQDNDNKNNLSINKNLTENKENTANQTTKEIDISSFQLNSKTNNENKKNDNEVEWKLNPKQNKIEYANITPGLDSVLLKKCKEKVWREYEDILREKARIEEWDAVESEIELRFLKIQQDLDKKDSFVAVRLGNAITKARMEIEWHDVSIIRLQDFIEGYHFEITFTRIDCIEWIRELERDSLISAGMKTIATNCPNCDAPLLGSYTCRRCGFELEKPEDAIRRRLLQIASYEPFENLKKGHIMVIDVVNHKIMEVDPTRKVVWEIRKDALHAIEVELDRPRDAVRLKNNITLMVDYSSNRVFKLTPKGRLFWELDYKYSDEHELKNPVSISGLESGNTIIVDFGNNRVFEVTEDQEIVWSYGQKGKEGVGENLLKKPTFCQRTAGATNIITDAFNHRIIEIRDKKIVWQYGNEKNVEGSSAKGSGTNQLNTPLSAWRMGDQTTVILDSGNKRVIEVNLEKELLWEYKTDQEGETVENPIRIYKLRSGNILIVGDKTVVEVDYRTRKACWVCPMEELMTDSDKEVRVVEENVKKIKVFHGVSNRYNQRSNPNNQTLSELLSPEKVRTSSFERANKSHVITTPNAKISDITIPFIDRASNIINIINRKGTVIWSFGEDGVLAKPSYVLIKNNSIFVSDTDNKRIIEIDKETKNILWSFDNSTGKLTSPKGFYVTDNNSLLISDSHHAKVFEVNKEDNSIIWEYDNNLKSPHSVSRLKNNNTLIVDWMNHFISEVNENKEIVWTYGTHKISGKDDGKLSYPEYAERLENNNTLIADTKNSRIIEISTEGKIVWFFEGQGITKLMSPSFVKRLPDGNTLIIHNNNRQIVEIDTSGKILWKYIN